MNLPVFALSVRQPWAWAIIHAGKDMENRSWKRWMKDWKFRGRIAIHASSGMTQDEYTDAAAFMAGCEPGLGVRCPPPGELIRGGIIGTVEIVDNVWDSASPWFMGPGALVLAHAQPQLPIAAKGQLGLFQWKPGGELRDPAKWMMPKPTVETLL
jgi:hypothetical protein